MPSLWLFEARCRPLTAKPQILRLLKLGRWQMGKLCETAFSLGALMEDSQSRCSLCFWLITALHQDAQMQDKFNSLSILLSFVFSLTNTK